MADIEAIAKGLGIILGVADAILIKKKVDKLAGGSGGRDASTEDIKAIIKTTVKDITLGKKGARKMSGGQAQGFTRGGAQLVGMIPRIPKSKHRKGIGSTGSKYQPKTYSKGGGVRKPKMTTGY